MTDVQVRDAQPGDRAAIEAVTLGAYQQYAAVMAPPHWASYREDILATLADVQSAARWIDRHKWPRWSLRRSS